MERKERRGPGIGILAVALATALMTACGGGGGGGGGSTFVPANAGGSGTGGAGGSASTGGTGGTGSPPILHVESGPALRDPLSASSAGDISVMQLSLTNAGQGPISIRELTFEVTGDLDESTDIQDLAIIRDTNSNGRRDTGEPLIAISSFSADDAPLRFMAFNEVLAAGERRDLLITASLAGTAVESERFALRLASALDVMALSPDGQTVQLTGLPVAGRWCQIGRWTAPKDIVALPVEVLNPRVVADDQGHLFMAFFRNWNFKSDVYYTYFNGRYWSEPFNVSNMAETSWLQDIAITSQGVPIIVWEQFASANSSRDIYTSRFDPATFSWTAPEALTSTTMEEGHPKVAVDSQDVVHVVWEQSDAGLMEIVHRSFDGSTWSSPEVISSGQGMSSEVAIAAAGAGVDCVWSDFEGADFVVRARSLSGGQWGPERIAARSAMPLSKPVTARLTGGTQVIGFTTGTANGQAVATVDLPAASPPTPMTILSGSQNFADELALIATPGDGLEATWQGTPNANVETDVYSSRRVIGQWTRAECVSHSPGISEKATIALDGRTGEPVIVFNDRSSGRFRIMESRVDSTGWDLTREVTVGPTELSTVSLGEDPAGGVHAVWHGDAGGNYEIFHAVNKGLGWSIPENISRSPAASYQGRVAVTADGTVHVVYEEVRQGLSQIMHVTGQGGIWSSPAAIAVTAGDSWNPSIAVLGRDEVLVGWSEKASGAAMIATVSRLRAGVWSSPTALSAGADDAMNVHVSADAEGRAAAVWEHNPGTGSELELATLGAGGWESPLAIAVGQAPRAAWTTNGALQIVFSEGFGSGSIIRHVTVTGRGASATISAVTDLSSPIAGAYTPRIAARGDDLHVVWEDKALGEAEVFYSAFKGGAWTAPASISRSPAHSNRPSVTIDRGGLVHVAWHEQDGADQRVAHVTRR